MDKIHDVDKCERAKKQVQEIMAKLGDLPEESKYHVKYNYSNVVKMNKLKTELAALIAWYYEGSPLKKAYNDALYYMQIGASPSECSNGVTSEEYNHAKDALNGLLDNIMNELNNPAPITVPNIVPSTVILNQNIAVVDIIELLEQTVENEREIPLDKKEAILEKLRELANNPYIVNLGSSILIESIKKSDRPNMILLAIISRLTRTSIN